MRSWLRFQRRNSVAMVSKVSNISPKACTPIELRRVGVIFTRREQLFKCVRCGAFLNVALSSPRNNAMRARGV